MRPLSAVPLAVAAAVLGAVAALGIGNAAGWIGGTDTVIVGAPQPRSGDAITAPLDTSAKPLVGEDFRPARIYAARRAGVVTIFAFFGDEDDDGAAASQGSGFVVSRDGLVLTNSHVVTTAGEGSDDVENARAVYIQFADGDRVQGRILGFDPFTDVAVVRVPAKQHQLAPVPLGDSSSVVVGQPVAAIGSPFGNESSLTVGVVSATERSIRSLTSRYNLVDAIQTDAPINRGNSGGPMFDARGRVIGINAQIRSESGNAEGVGFAVPINSAKRSMEQLIADGRVRYAWLGISTQTVIPRIADHFDLGAQRGAAITLVRPNSPADRAGLRPGDREEEFNGVAFPVGADVIVAIAGTPVRGA